MKLLPWRGSRPRHRALGDAARDRRDWPEALAQYRSHLESFGNANDGPIWVQLGHAYKETGQLGPALAAYRRAVALMPDEADAHLQLGHCLKLMGSTAEAARAYDEALRLAPALDSARQDRAALDGPAARVKVDLLATADAARDRQDWTSAAERYAQFLANPANAHLHQIWVQLGHAQKEAGQNDDALASYRRAVVLAPGDADGHLQLGRQLRLMGSHAEAAVALGKALEIEPELRDAMKELAQMPAPNGESMPDAPRTPPLEDDEVKFDVAVPKVAMRLSEKLGR